MPHGSFATRQEVPAEVREREPVTPQATMPASPSAEAGVFAGARAANPPSAEAGVGMPKAVGSPTRVRQLVAGLEAQGLHAPSDRNLAFPAASRDPLSRAPHRMTAPRHNPHTQRIATELLQTVTRKPPTDDPGNPWIAMTADYPPRYTCANGCRLFRVAPDAPRHSSASGCTARY